MSLSSNLTFPKRTFVLAVAIIVTVGAVAFALLQSRSFITGSTISTGSANLLISADGVHYSQSVPGFDFDSIIPGGYPSPIGGQPIYLKNTGSLPLDLTLSINNQPSNPSDADLNLLDVGLTDVSGQTRPRGFMLGLLMTQDGGLPIEGQLAPGATREYQLQALAADDAPAGITVGNIDLAFTGTAHDPNEPPHD